ncbi:MAG: S-adenosylmethionine decarboxylase [Bacteroidota bacterium]
MEARIENFSTWISGDTGEALRSQVEHLLKESQFTILNFMEHHFEPQGYTAVWLLAESHCALHTFPEENKAYVELSSCNIQMYTDFIVHFNQHFHQPLSP